MTLPTWINTILNGNWCEMVQKVKDGTFAVRLAPKQQKDITLQVPAYKSTGGSEYFLNVYAYTSKKSATELVPAGHEVAREQFKIGR